jgi:putative restriction endonuclease
MAFPATDIRDAAIRKAAFDHIAQLNVARPHLSSADLKRGFLFEGERIPLVNPQRGIFKPRQMRYLLSIRTVFPRRGARIWYDDQRTIHEQIFRSTELVEYAFMGTNPEASDNRLLRDAMTERIPIIYFIGTAPTIYVAVTRAFICGWDAATLKAKVGFEAPTQRAEDPPSDAAPTRRYALRAVQQRLHQSSFRAAVIAAYDQRCAVSGVPEPLLLDAAHIINDRDEEFGHPVVPNGLPLSKIHHAAFDAHLIGIDPGFRVHVARRLRDQHDGPTLQALKDLEGRLIRLPARKQDFPDQDRLAIRFKAFKSAA